MLFICLNIKPHGVLIKKIHMTLRVAYMHTIQETSEDHQSYSIILLKTVRLCLKESGKTNLVFINLQMGQVR